MECALFSGVGSILALLNKTLEIKSLPKRDHVLYKYSRNEKTGSEWVSFPLFCVCFYYHSHNFVYCTHVFKREDLFVLSQCQHDYIITKLWVIFHFKNVSQVLLEFRLY